MPSAGSPPPVQIPDEGLSQTSKGPVSKVLSSLEGEAGPGPCGRCFTQKGWVFMSFSPTAPPLRPQRQHMLYVMCMGDPMEAGASWCYCGLPPHKAGRTRLRGYWHTAHDESHTCTHLYSFQPSVSVFFSDVQRGFFGHGKVEVWASVLNVLPESAAVYSNCSHALH